jgi:hypothetical protein
MSTFNADILYIMCYSIFVLWLNNDKITPKIQQVLFLSGCWNKLITCNIKPMAKYMLSYEWLRYEQVFMSMLNS